MPCFLVEMKSDLEPLVFLPISFSQQTRICVIYLPELVPNPHLPQLFGKTPDKKKTSEKKTSKKRQNSAGPSSQKPDTRAQRKEKMAQNMEEEEIAQGTSERPETREDRAYRRKERDENVVSF